MIITSSTILSSQAYQRNPLDFVKQLEHFIYKYGFNRVHHLTSSTDLFMWTISAIWTMLPTWTILNDWTILSS